MMIQLDEKNLWESAHWLAERDRGLALVLDRYGYPPLWARKPGFATLTHMILEQQVSLASANAAFQRLGEQLGAVTPGSFLTLDDEALRRIGFSRQKTRYVRNLAKAVAAGDIVLEKLPELPDEEAHHTLTRLKGIGAWTADIYLTMCLLRPDILPRGDIALQEALRVLHQLPARPAHPEFEAATRHWRPWRSVGTRMLWHFYLCERGR